MAQPNRYDITHEEFNVLPLASDDELDIVASLAMQELYEVFRDRGGRQLDNCTAWAAVAGYLNITGA